MWRVALLLSVVLAAPAASQTPPGAWYRCDAFGCHWWWAEIDVYDCPPDCGLAYLEGRIFLKSKLKKPGLVEWYEYPLRFWQIARFDRSLFETDPPNDFFFEEGAARSGTRMYEIGFAAIETYEPEVSRIVVRYEDGTTSDWNIVSAVPEPASLVLLGTGLVAIGAMRRRKRRSA